LLASGADIWGAADQFRFFSRSLAGDGSVIAQIVQQAPNDPFAKAGLMLRASDDPGAVFYALELTPANGILVQAREQRGADAIEIATTQGTAPTFLRIARSGSTFAAFTSKDGSTWTEIPGSATALPSMPGTTLAGLAVSSHDNTTLGSATFVGAEVTPGR
jgi:hypothetical protein